MEYRAAKFVRVKYAARMSNNYVVLQHSWLRLKLKKFAACEQILTSDTRCKSEMYIKIHGIECI